MPSWKSWCVVCRAGRAPSDFRQGPGQIPPPVPAAVHGFLGAIDHAAQDGQGDEHENKRLQEFREAAGETAESERAREQGKYQKETRISQHSSGSMIGLRQIPPPLFMAGNYRRGQVSAPSLWSDVGCPRQGS
jgi:hypothetical protein